MFEHYEYREGDRRHHLVLIAGRPFPDTSVVIIGRDKWNFLGTSVRVDEGVLRDIDARGHALYVDKPLDQITDRIVPPRS